MRVLLAAAAAAIAVAVAAGSAQGAGGVFVVVEQSSSLPSSDVPNSLGAVSLGPELLTPPAAPEQLSLEQLDGLWHDAGAAYGIPWQVLAAINQIESNFGQNMGPSSAGAIGWMQFMPSTWLRWGVDADADGVANPWNATDAVYAAGRYLAAAGGRTDISRALFAYNHAYWYVEDVLQLASQYGQGGIAMPYPLLGVGLDLERAELRVAELSKALTAAIARETVLARPERKLRMRADAAQLLSTRLNLNMRAVRAGVRLDTAAAETQRLRDELAAAEETLAAARTGSLALLPAAQTLFGNPLSVGDYVFPVGGGPSVVSVAHTHHDYPAADIAAPSGAPLYSLTDGVVIRGWALPEGRCGIGFTMRAADGRSWTYCHLSYLEPAVTAGALLTGGMQVGLVGSTGTTSSGPHLHLQLAPAASYPQAEAWFQAFAGTAFTWQDAPTIVRRTPLFEVVPTVEELSDGPLVLFDRS